MLHSYFWSGAPIMCCFGWIQWQPFSHVFYWAHCCFLHDIILKEDANNVNCKETQLSFQTQLADFENSIHLYKKYFWKQLSQAICSKQVFRLLHAPKFQMFSTKINMMVKVVKLFTVVLWKICCDKFYRKTPMQESLC